MPTIWDGLRPLPPPPPYTRNEISSRDVRLNYRGSLSAANLHYHQADITALRF